MSETIKTKGRGILLVPTMLWEDLGGPCTSEQWHKVLLLPDEYTVVEWGLPGIGLSTHDYLTLYVEHTDIPVVEEIANLPEVRLRHRAEYHGQTKTVFLDRIEIWAWQDGQWKQVQRHE